MRFLPIVLACAAGLAATACTSSKKVDAMQQDSPATATSPLFASKWELAEIMGKAVEPGPDGRRPHLVLDAAQERAFGFAGCNRFSGGFTVDEATGRITLGPLAATMMACASMEVETAFMEALQTADNYTLVDGVLSLNKARMAPLARLQAAPLDK